MESHYKPKVTSRVEYDRPRPVSPFKPQPPPLASSPSLPVIRAKINSSATVIGRRQNLTTSGTRPQSVISPSPRSPSPFKRDPPGSTHHAPAPSVVKARLTTTNVRANGLPASPAPEARQRAQTAAAPEAHPPRTRARNGSISSHVSYAPSSAPSPSRSPTSSRVTVPSEENGSAHAALTIGVVRVKSKVSRLAEPGPSVSSFSVSPPPHSPIGSVGAHHRFPTARDGHAQRAHAFQPFPAHDDLAVRYSGYAMPVPAKPADPAAIPLPPQSPPTSTLSFSSRSSASRSSVSYDTRNTDTSRNTAPGRARYHPEDGLKNVRGEVSSQAAFLASAASSPSDGSFDEEEDDERGHPAAEDDSKAEAKSNRKIADLEITNRSLLAINSTLEATKHRQAKEIRDLKRKLRESRLILPPPAYRAVKSTLTHDDTAEDDEHDADADADDEDEDADEDEQALLDGRDDEPYRRVKVMLDSLLDAAACALASTSADFAEGGRSGAKVLSAEEVRTWRGDDPETRSLATEDSTLDGRPPSLSRIAVPNSDSDSDSDSDSLGMDSEREVAASLLAPASTPASPLPPIKVTHSP